MGWRLAADGVVLLHAAFIIFIVLGGFAVRRWPGLLWAHVMTVAYGFLIEVVGFTCPLTPLEKSFRTAAGEAGYEGGFIEHYVVSLIYPGGLDAAMKAMIFLSLLAVTLTAYAPWWIRRGRTAG